MLSTKNIAEYGDIIVQEATDILTQKSRGYVLWDNAIREHMLDTQGKRVCFFTMEEACSVASDVANEREEFERYE